MDSNSELTLPLILFAVFVFLSLHYIHFYVLPLLSR